MQADHMLQLIIIKEKNDLDKLKRPINGSGGFQTLLKRIGKQLKRNIFTLTLELASDIVRYV